MMWQDLLLEREVSWPNLRSALAKALGTRAELISIVKTVANDVSNSPVMAEVSEVSGDFKTRISLYLRNYPDLSVHEAVSNLASSLDMRLLVSDDSPNPYTMMLYEAGQAPRKVALDVDCLDQREEYRIADE